jgi:hypothetical protein
VVNLKAIPIRVFFGTAALRFKWRNEETGFVDFRLAAR